MTACALVLGTLVACPQPGLTARRMDPVPIQAPAADAWFAEDKLRHFGVSFAATGMAFGAARLALDAAPARTAAVAVGAGLGLGKELRDARVAGRFSLKDLAWDAAGVALGYLFVQQIQ